MLFIKVNVDTECISKMFTDNVFHLFFNKLSHLAIHPPFMVATALLLIVSWIFFNGLFRHWQHLVKAKIMVWFNTKNVPMCLFKF